MLPFQEYGSYQISEYFFRRFPSQPAHSQTTTFWEKFLSCDHLPLSFHSLMAAAPFVPAFLAPEEAGPALPSHRPMWLEPKSISTIVFLLKTGLCHVFRVERKALVLFAPACTMELPLMLDGILGGVIWQVAVTSLAC